MPSHLKQLVMINVINLIDTNLAKDGEYNERNIKSVEKKVTRHAQTPLSSSSPEVKAAFVLFIYSF